MSSLVLVDGGAEFVGEGQLASFVASDDNKDIGKNYKLVGIFGGQSTGKSTLVNHMFGTKFDTMSAEVGRSQTTKGIHICKAVSGKGMFVMDFEGTDGMERGDDQSFERFFALFALASTDALLMNMWANEVGRFNAANLGLLRTVFEVNIQLFGKERKSKTVLVFVIRDHTTGPAEKLFENVRNSLGMIWEGIKIPEGETRKKMEDWFDLQFCALPHFELQHDLFVEKVKLLQTRFVSPSSKDYIFAESSHRDVRLTDLELYLRSCWSSIKTSKDLDIPTQRAMLSRLRCSEASDSILAEALKNFKPWHDSIKSGTLVENLSELALAVQTGAVDDFKEAVAAYIPSVVDQAAADLKLRLQDEVDKVLDLQLKKVTADVAKAVESSVNTVMEDAIHSLARATGEEEDDPCTAALRAGYEKLLKKATADMTSEKYKGMLGASAAKTATASIQDALLAKFRQRQAGIAVDITTHMLKLFHNHLSYEADGKVRFIATTAGLLKVYPLSHSAGLQLLDSMFIFRLGDKSLNDCRVSFDSSATSAATRLSYPDIPAKHKEDVLIDQAQVELAFHLYSAKAEGEMKLQQRNIEAGQGSVPPWAMIALVVLGFNEFWYVITSPVLLLFVGVVVYVFFRSAVVKQWAKFIETGPPGVTIPAQAIVDRIGAQIQQFKDGDAKKKKE